MWVAGLSLKPVPNVPNPPAKCLILLMIAALPRECSTTELRQQAEAKNHAAEAVHRLEEIARRCLP